MVDVRPPTDIDHPSDIEGLKKLILADQACASNLKQIGLAFMQYSQDYDEKLTASNWYGNVWDSRVYPYVKATGV